VIEYTVKVDNGDTRWYLNGKLHREDGPAVEFACGTKSWCLNGELHRADGPAIEYADGNKSWYINGVKVTEQAVMNPIKQLTVAQVEALLGYAVKIVAG
jgi:hypothetical protein